MADRLYRNHDVRFENRNKIFAKLIGYKIPAKWAYRIAVRFA